MTKTITLTVEEVATLCEWAGVGIREHGDYIGEYGQYDYSKSELAEVKKGLDEGWALVQDVRKRIGE